MKYQAAFLLIAFTVVATAYALSNSFLGLGDINAPFEIGVLNLEVNPLVSWTVVGISLVIAFGIPTYFLVSSSLSKVVHWPSFLSKFGGWILFISALNAFSEELVYRGALITISEQHLTSWQTALLSAVIFSLAHIKGQTNGVLILMGSAIVGWCLAYSVLQTHGLFWAWCIHFTQDIFIFAAFIANMSNKSIEKGGLSPSAHASIN